MKITPTLLFALSIALLPSCKKAAETSGVVNSQEVDQRLAEERRKEALESLKHIQERDARDAELTDKIKNTPPPR